MTNLTKEETGWMRSATPALFLEITRELQQRNEAELALTIPQLAPPYGSHPLNRQATAMLTLAAALTETLTGRPASMQTALGKLSQEKDSLPEETAILWRKAEVLRRTLFDPERGILVRVYILHALDPRRAGRKRHATRTQKGMGRNRRRGQTGQHPLQTGSLRNDRKPPASEYHRQIGQQKAERMEQRQVQPGRGESGRAGHHQSNGKWAGIPERKKNIKTPPRQDYKDTRQR